MQALFRGKGLDLQSCISCGKPEVLSVETEMPVQGLHQRDLYSKSNRLFIQGGDSHREAMNSLRSAQTPIKR